MKEKEAKALLQIQSSKGIGARRGKQLVDRFGSARKVLQWAQLNEKQLPHWAKDLLRKSGVRKAEEEWNLAQSKGLQIFGYGGKKYPALLRELADPPLVFFTEGPVDLSRSPALSVVGTRRMTPYGAGFCRELIEEIRAYDPMIISGFAEGIDITVQMEAVQSGLSTLACMAHGLGHLYPGIHKRFRRSVLERGGFLSEYNYHLKPEKSRFVQRNRLIAGLSPATLVVQSGEKGGSLLTADLALGYHREVFAVPGRSTDPQNRGCLTLIRDHKAQALYDPRDLIEFLQWKQPKSLEKEVHYSSGNDVNSQLPKTERSILDYLQKNGKTPLNTLKAEVDLPVKRLMEDLLELELDGFIRSRPGNIFELV